MTRGDEIRRARQRRCKVARDPNTPPETLRELAGDEYVMVRLLVAENPNTPDDVRRELWKEFPPDKEIDSGERF